MAEVAHEHAAHGAHGAKPPPTGLRRWLLAPGWLRVPWMTPLFAAIGFGIVVGIRALAGWEPILFWPIIVTVAFLTAAPIGFLAGLGAFDYWVQYAIGAPTEPEDHSGHGAQELEGLLPGQHRPQGDRDPVRRHDDLLLPRSAGLLAMLVRAELAQPGMQYVDPQTYNGLFSVHASLMIFLFVIPAFAGLANFVLPLMIGAPDMAFPRLNALSYWLLPIAGDDDAVELPRRPAAPSRPAGRATRRSRIGPAVRERVLPRWGCSGRARRRS